MQSNIASGITVIRDSSQQETVEVIRDTASKAIAIIREYWGLENPQDCRIYVMTSWLGFTFQSAPRLWRIPLAITLPLWFSRARLMWPYAGAWTQRFGRRVAIGIKPPSLVEASDKSIGRLMYAPDMDKKTKLEMFTCHELTHAFSSYLRLPAWLNEGLAMVTVERCLGKQTIRNDTLELMRDNEFDNRPPAYAKLARLKAEEIAHYTVLGYWIVQYLEEKFPGFIKGLLAAAPNSKMIENDIARKVGLEPAGFWSRIAPMIVAYYEMKGGPA